MAREVRSLRAELTELSFHVPEVAAARVVHALPSECFRM